MATDLEEELEGLDELVALGDGAVTPCVADVASEEDWRHVVETAGVVDVLVNNAGGHGRRTSRHELRPLGRGARRQSPRRHARDPGRARADAPGGGGSIVNVSSVAGLMREPYRPVEYAAAKAGVVAVTTSLGSLWESDRISVTCICPDWVLTEAVERTVAAMTPEERAEVRGLVPVEEIAGLIVRLATDESLAGRVMVRGRTRTASACSRSGGRARACG